MEPFIVQCQACNSNIRIRNSNLIGQQISCPKCQTSILITGVPTETVRVQPVGRESVDSRAVTRDDIPTESMSSRAVPPNHDSPAQTTASTDRPFDNLDFSDDAETPSFELKLLDANNNNQSLPPGGWLPPQKAAPTEQWSTASTTRSRQYLLIGFLGLSGCLLALLLFTGFLRWYSRGSTQGNHQLAIQPAPPTPSQSTTVEETETSETLASDPADLHSESAVVQETRIAIAPSESNLAAMPEDEVQSAVNQTNATEVAPGMDRPLNQNKVSSDDGSSQESNQESEDDTASLPPQLAELITAIGEPFTISEPPKLIIPDQPIVTAEEINTGVNAGLIPPVARLSETAGEIYLTTLRIQQYQLPDVVSHWNLTVGIPTVVDPLTLKAANYDWNAKFDVELSGVTATVGIDQLANTLKLTAHTLENRFWLLNATTPSDAILPWNMPVNDLINDAQQSQWLIETLEQFIPAARNALTLNDGILQGSVDSMDRITWFAIVRLIENWRNRKGLPSKLPDYRPENLSQSFVTAEELPGLDYQLTELTATPQPLSRLLNRQCRLAGITCWVDWQALQFLPVRFSKQQVIGPQTLRTTVTHHRPLRKLLEELDSELGIATLLIDQNTIWLTSYFYYRRVPEIFVIPKDDKDIEGYWRQYLRPLTPIDQAGISQVLISETPDGQFIIVKCCWPTLQFE